MKLLQAIVVSSTAKVWFPEAPILFLWDWRRHSWAAECLTGPRQDLLLMVWRVMADVGARMATMPPLTTFPYSPPFSSLITCQQEDWNRLPSWACPIPESVKSQVGCGFEQPGLVESVPAAHVRTSGTRWPLKCFQPQTPVHDFVLYLSFVIRNLDMFRRCKSVCQMIKLGTFCHEEKRSSLELWLVLYDDFFSRRKQARLSLLLFSPACFPAANTSSPSSFILGNKGRRQ